MIKSHSLAIIEDEPELLKSMERVLTKKGYNIHTFKSCKDFFANPISKLDLILTDKNLPNMSGIELTQKIRLNNKTTPIFMITGKGSVESSILAYETGVDAFIAKPFDYDILDAKIKRTLTRIEIPKSVKLKFKKNTNELIYKEQTKILTPFEFTILQKLYKKNGSLVKREHLLGEDESRSLDVHISSLRKKLKSMELEIKTVKGKGYRLLFESV